MFLPNMLEIVATLYNHLDITKSEKTKLGCKDHRSLERHQTSYEEMTDHIVKWLAPDHQQLLKDYLVNAQYFLCTYNSAPFETESSKKEVLRAYWKFLYGPMLATLLHRFRDNKHEGSILNQLSELIFEWENIEVSHLRTRWAKDIIKRQLAVLVEKTPLFTAKINSISNKGVQSKKVIERNLKILNDELEGRTSLNSEDRTQLLQKVSSTYSAVMIIRKLEDKGDRDYLTIIRDILIDHSHESKTKKLWNIHSDICSLLMGSSTSPFTWDQHPLISAIDDFLLSEIKPTYPTIIEKLGEWPDRSILNYHFSMISICGVKPASPLEQAMFDYYRMYQCVEHGNAESALDYCKRVEAASKSVHLGVYRSLNLLHKIVLTYHINQGMKHNQFDKEICELIMTLPDQAELIVFIEPNTYEIFEKLNTSEQMMLRLFREFNANHKGMQVNPLKKVCTVVNAALEVCDNYDGSSKDMVQLLNKRLDKKYRRSKNLFPFTKKLSFAENTDTILDLYHFISVSINESIHNFHHHIPAKELVKTYGQN